MNNHNGNGHPPTPRLRGTSPQIQPLPCPLCGGELIYSQGSHDLICERNTLDAPNGIATLNGANAPREKDIDPPRGKSCIFAISMTESINSGALFSIRVDKAGVNYPMLSLVMHELQVRKRGQYARNYEDVVPNNRWQPEPKKTGVEKKADKYGLAVEDLFSIQHSTETTRNLAQYYGLTERQVMDIKRTLLRGNPDSM